MNDQPTSITVAEGIGAVVVLVGCGLFMGGPVYGPWIAAWFGVGAIVAFVAGRFLRGASDPDGFAQQRASDDGMPPTHFHTTHRD